MPHLSGQLARAVLDPMLPFARTMREATGESRSTSWRRVHRGEIAVVKVGSLWKARRSEIESLLNRIERGDI